MPLKHIPDIAYEVHEDGVNIEQSAGCGEVAMVTLHPIHVALLYREMRLGEVQMPPPDIYSEQLKTVRDEVHRLYNWIAPEDCDIQVEESTYLIVSGLKTLIDSMCDAIPKEKPLHEARKGLGEDSTAMATPIKTQAAQGSLALPFEQEAA